jgi:hypothetical protein
VPFVYDVALLVHNKIQISSHKEKKKCPLARKLLKKSGKTGKKCIFTVADNLPFRKGQSDLYDSKYSIMHVESVQHLILMFELTFRY